LEEESVSSFLDVLGGFKNEGDIQDSSVVHVLGGFDFDSSQRDGVEDSVEQTDQATGDDDQVVPLDTEERRFSHRPLKLICVDV